MADVDFPLRFHDLPAEPLDLSPHGFAPFPIEGEVEALLTASPPRGWQATGDDRNGYLDLAEPMVRMAAAWVDDDGAVIDPVLGTEWNQTSPRFAAAAAVLIHFGRCRDLLPVVCRVMRLCCARMADGRAAGMSPDFWMRELITADCCLRGIAPAGEQAAWQADLRRVDPERLYRDSDPGHGEKMAGFHNWAVYGSGGEALRELVGLVPAERETNLCGAAFFDTYMQPQLRRLTDHGMYRDPDDPITYDITTRLQIALPMVYGHRGPLTPVFQELLRRGGLTLLLMLSSEGFVPYGGRSSQYNWQEAMTAALCEIEARRYAGRDPQLAGAFKRQAHLCAAATRPWLMAEPIRHIKNRYLPETSHGIDHYGQYSVYGLLAASFFGLAALLADDEIAEAPTPTEIGGAALVLQPAFHKVMATAGGTSIEIDTAADHKHNTTGLGRVLFAGTPLPLVLASPMSSTAHYRLAPGVARTATMTAIGPGWPVGEEELLLAALSENLGCAVHIDERSSESMSLELVYDHRPSGSRIIERYTLARGVLRCSSRIAIAGTPVPRCCFRLPALITDGQAKAEQTLDSRSMTCRFNGHAWRANWGPGIKAHWEDAPVSNRHGCYRVLRLDAASDSIAVEVALL